MWPTVALWLAAFGLTWIENVISTRGGRADRQSTASKTNRYSKIAANWDVLFNIVLLVDTWLVVSQGFELLIPISAGAWLGTYTELERRRAKFRSRTKRRKSPRASNTNESQANDVQAVD